MLIAWTPVRNTNGVDQFARSGNDGTQASPFNPAFSGIFRYWKMQHMKRILYDDDDFDNEPNRKGLENLYFQSPRTGLYAVIGCKLKQNSNDRCNSCASLTWLVLCFIACFISLVIASSSSSQWRCTGRYAVVGCNSCARLAWLLVVAPIIFKFYCKFYYSCDPSITHWRFNAG